MLKKQLVDNTHKNKQQQQMTILPSLTMLTYRFIQLQSLTGIILQGLKGGDEQT